MEENNNTTPEPEKKKKNNGTLKIVLIAICCALVGGIIGGTLVSLTHNHFTFDVMEDGKGFFFENRFHFGRPFRFHIGDIEDFAEEILRDTYIGVSASDSEDPEGAYINDVEKGSPADKAGLKTGDVVTMIDNKKIDDRADLSAAIEHAKAGDKMELTIYRDGKTSEVTVTIGERSRWD